MTIFIGPMDCRSLDRRSSEPLEFGVGSPVAAKGGHVQEVAGPAVRLVAAFHLAYAG